MTRPRPAKHATKAPIKSKKTAVPIAPARLALDALEAICSDVAELDALASAVDGEVEIAFDSRPNRRRFLCALNLFTERAKVVHVAAERRMNRLFGKLRKRK